MTGKELSKARKEVGLTQQALADLCQVHWQVVGGWERRREENVRAEKGKASLEQYYKCMTAIRDFLAHTQLAVEVENGEKKGYVPSLTIPAPCSYYYINKGEPLILSDEPAVAGDLICLFDGTRYHDICRVQPTRKPGELVTTDGKGIIGQVPPPTNYRVINYALHKFHDTNPDTNGLLRFYMDLGDEFPPDMR